MRVGEQFLERRIAHAGIDTGHHEAGVVGLAAEQGNVGQGRGRRWRWLMWLLWLLWPLWLLWLLQVS